MIKIAVLGCGTVGGGVCQLLIQNAHDIAKRTDKCIEIKKVLERNPQRAYDLGLKEDQVCSSLDDILNDDEIKIVVELMGGIDFAYECIMKAIDAGKNIVTANKDLISVKGEEIFSLAKEKNVDVCYEASVGGAIPIIGAMQNILCANTFTDIVGILNGTTNYILSKMYEKGWSYSKALQEATDLGYAEADPSSDVEGTDAARKISILGSIAFNSRCTLSDVYCEGITRIEERDIVLAKKLGYTIKLLAVAKERNNKILLFVRPAFVPLAHPLASVNDVFNAAFIKCDAADEIMLYGRGAGSMPTASSVIGDVMTICQNIANGTTGKLGLECYKVKEISPVTDLRSSFCLRLRVADQPNVLAGVASVLGKKDVSIESIIQSPVKNSGTASLTIITHPASEQDLQTAIEELKACEYVKKANIYMCLDMETM
ncbi:MAG: homoserine dehydrogenase [Epulopiscium sp. Nele67-Bin002]|nr:MAG: homoserine dehydrogenase [Epulopiscium sp. Nele67-Bin002]OON91973.1 MAG: homoserine dehydrogenase [Epulopiscium sp. Nele67-Bin001]